MPVYNGSEYLKRAIESFKVQSFQDFELIMVDDKSSDDSVEICKKYSKENENFRLIEHSSNLGVSEARNTGLKAAKGELVVFVDCDDWVDRDYLEFFTTTIEKYDVDMVTCGFMVETDKSSHAKGVFQNNGTVIDRNEMFQRIVSLNGTVMGYTWNKVYKLDIITKNNLKFASDVDLMEDAIFNVQYASVANKFYYTTEPYYHYYQRKNSATHKYFDFDNVKDVGVANFRIHKQMLQNLGEQLTKDKGSK